MQVEEQQQKEEEKMIVEIAEIEKRNRGACRNNYPCPHGGRARIRSPRILHIHSGWNGRDRTSIAHARCSAETLDFRWCSRRKNNAIVSQFAFGIWCHAMRRYIFNFREMAIFLKDFLKLIAINDGLIFVDCVELWFGGKYDRITLKIIENYWMCGSARLYAKNYFTFTLTNWWTFFASKPNSRLTTVFFSFWRYLIDDCCWIEHCCSKKLKLIFWPKNLQ